MVPAVKMWFVVVLSVLMSNGVVLANTGPGASRSLDVHRRFEYKLSFKGPHLTQRDGTIPFWEIGGSAIASDESVRVTPSLRSKKGYVWSTEKITSEHWEVEVSFRVSGRGRIGADGLAIWFTEEKGVEGPVFGSSDKWKGLGVFFDSFDNDNRHNNPYILAMANDGTKSYDHKSDGLMQQLGGCLRDFRNKPFPVHVRIEYYKKALTVYFHNGMSEEPENQYELCLRAEEVDLPKEGYFGVSAATGGLADDHDVQSFITHSLRPLDDIRGTGQAVPEDDRQKFQKEFEEYYQKLQKAKEEYLKEHPDATERPGDYEFEGLEARELKQIYEAQDAIHAILRDLNTKIDAIVGRQERTLSQLSIISQGGVAQGGGGGGGRNPTPQIAGGIQQHEVDELLRHGRDVSQTVKLLQNKINEVQTKQQQGGAGGAAAGGNYEQDVKNNFNELKNSLRTLQNDVKTVANTKSIKCPEIISSSCISTTTFLVICMLQMAIFIGYNVYKSNKEASAKKFY